MSASRPESQIGAKMELRHKEHGPEEQSDKPQTMSIDGHVGT